MNNLSKLNNILRSQGYTSDSSGRNGILIYAEHLSKIENVMVVISNLREGTSRIFSGKLGVILGIEYYDKENSIWEKNILNLMTPEEREEKYLAELRFFNFLRHVPHKARSNFYLISKLRFKAANGEVVDILHRMYYVYDASGDVINYAVCIYERMTFDIRGRSFAVNSITGLTEELTPAKDISILSRREQQVLKLIDSGKTSAEIATILSISKNTVSRHRQEILAKLQVKNSVEACRIAKSIGLL